LPLWVRRKKRRKQKKKRKEKKKRRRKKKKKAGALKGLYCSGCGALIFGRHFGSKRRCWRGRAIAAIFLGLASRTLYDGVFSFFSYACTEGTYEFEVPFVWGFGFEKKSWPSLPSNKGKKRPYRKSLEGGPVGQGACESEGRPADSRDEWAWPAGARLGAPIRSLRSLARWGTAKRRQNSAAARLGGWERKIIRGREKKGKFLLPVGVQSGRREPPLVWPAGAEEGKKTQGLISRSPVG